MAILRAYQAIDMLHYDVRHWDRTVVSNQVVRFGSSGDSIAYHGAIWHPDSWEPSGTLRAVSAEQDGAEHFSLFDFARPVRQPFQALQLIGERQREFQIL